MIAEISRTRRTANAKNFHVKLKKNFNVPATDRFASPRVPVATANPTVPITKTNRTAPIVT